MTDYYEYLSDWEKVNEEVIKDIYAWVHNMPDENFSNCGDMVRGYKRDLSHLLIEKAISPYNFFRDRRMQEVKEEAIEFTPAGDDEDNKIVAWAPEGVATEEADYFDFKYNDGRTAKVPKSSLKEKYNSGGKFFTTRIKDIPTNIFPRDDSTNLWNLHEYKAR